MNEVKLGEKIRGNAERDAVHVAVFPCVAAMDLEPGDRIALDDRGMAVKSDKWTGIVDPFLDYPVTKGERFWLCVRPGTVCGMRHHWLHSAFDSTPYMDSEKWLREYAIQMNTYECADDAFDTLIKGLGSGELFAHGTDLHGLYELVDADELRFHAERYLGIQIDWNKFSFNCSC